MATHYVCSGTCRGVAEEAGVCQTVDCPNYHQSLEACDCQDGHHHKPQAEQTDDRTSV